MCADADLKQFGVNEKKWLQVNSGEMVKCWQICV